MDPGKIARRTQRRGQEPQLAFIMLAILLALLWIWSSAGDVGILG